MSDERLFFIRTYGCQMNVHDSQKLARLLRREGLSEAGGAEFADLLVINTCSIRDKAESQLYSDLGALRAWKEARPGRVIGVGGCVAQQRGDALLNRFAHLDFVFGTHNLRWVGSMLEAAWRGRRTARTDETRSLARFDLPLPAARDGVRAACAYLTVMEGCDMFCSFCIVPSTRGREISRPAEAILAEAEALESVGAREITLLGQTVNAYGRHDARRAQSASAGTVAFPELLRRLDALPGIERIRYTSPHPLFFDEALIDAHGTLEKLCPHVHLPLQSGSDSVLAAMRRRYGAGEFLAIVEALRNARPDIAVTSDLIVGFPGETEADFEQTLEVTRRAGFVDSYSFKYSARPGTAAADLPGAVDPGEAQRRLVELQRLQRELTLAYHRSRIGGTTRIRVEGESRRGAGQLCGRDPWHRVVNLAEPAGADSVAAAPGRLLDVEIVEATPHSLIGRPLMAGRPDGRIRPKIVGDAVKPALRSSDGNERGGRPATESEGPPEAMA